MRRLANSALTRFGADTYRALITAPRVAIQPFLLLDPKADLTLAARYTI